MSDERKTGRPGDDSSVITKSRSETKKPSMYKVLLLNDDYTPMEFDGHCADLCRVFSGD